MQNSIANAILVSRLVGEPGISTSGLKFWIPFITSTPNGTAGQLSPDVSGNNHPAILKTGKSLDFDGSTTYIDLDGFSMNSTNATVAFWINPDATTGNVFHISSNSLIVGFNSNEISIFSGSWKNFGSLTTGVWSRVVVTINGTTAKCFVNGVQLGVDETITAINISSATLARIGARNNGSADFIDAKLSDFQIWNTAWSQDDAIYDYANRNVLASNNTSSSAVALSSLELLLPLDEGSGNLAMDNISLASELITGGNFPAVNLTNGYAFNDGSWTTLTSTVIDADTYDTSGDGGVYKGLFTIGSTYEINIAGTTTATVVQLRNTSNADLYYQTPSTGSFSTQLTFQPSHSDLFIKNIGAGETTISTLEVKEIFNGWQLESLGTDLMSGYAFNDGSWTSIGTVTFNSATSYSITAAGGGIYKNLVTSGTTYKFSIVGTTDNLFQVRNPSNSDLYYQTTAGDFSTTFIATVTSNEIYLPLPSGGTVTLSSFIVQEVASFDGDSYSVSNSNVATIKGGSSTTSQITQGTLIENKKYKATFTVDAVSGSGTKELIAYPSDTQITEITTTGDKVILFNAALGGDIAFKVAQNSSNILSISNVSVRETPQLVGQIKPDTAPTWTTGESVVPQLGMEDWSEGTNLLLASQTFNNIAWVKSGSATALGDTILSPSNSFYADTLNSLSSASLVTQSSIPLTASSRYVWSIFIRDKNIASGDYTKFRVKDSARALWAAEFTWDDLTLTQQASGSSTIYTPTVTPFALDNPEIITNGNFSNGTTDWEVSNYNSLGQLASISVSDNVLKLVNDQSGDWRSKFVIQDTGSSMVDGKTYVVKFDLRGNASGNIRLSTDFESAANAISDNIAITSNFVSHSITFTGVSNPEMIAFGVLDWQTPSTPDNSYIEIANVSIKEVNWFRVSFGFDSTTTGNYSVEINPSNGNGSIYAWGAQMELDELPNNNLPSAYRMTEAVGMVTTNYQGTLTTDINNPGFDILSNKLRSREQSLNLDGVGFAEITDDSNLDVTNFTLDGWAKYEFIDSGSVNVIYANGKAIGDSSTFGIGTIVSGYVRAIVDTTVLDSTVAITRGQWFYFALTRQGSDVKLYINEETAVTATSGGTVNNNLVKTFGKDTNSTTNYNELISDLRLYNRALSSSEISSNYALGKPSHT